MTDKDVKLVSTEELAEMDAQTQYLSPIFGSYASDVEMPVDKLNHDPIEPRIASEIIREYIGTEGNAHQNLCTFVQTYMEPEAAELMKMTARDLLQNEVIDKMFLEPKEGLENNLEYTADALKEALCETIPKLQKKDIDELLEERYNRFRKFGEFIE